MSSAVPGPTYAATSAIATQTICPPGFFRSVSRSAKQASSWSRASSGSMVTNGSSDRSSRPARPTGFAATDSAIASSGKPSGIPCRCMAISDTDPGAAGSPSVAAIRAAGKPMRPLRAIGSASTNSPSLHPRRGRIRDAPFLSRTLLDRHDATALRALTINPENPARVPANTTDQTCFISVWRSACHRGQSGEDPVARSKRRTRWSMHNQDAWLRPCPIPPKRTGEEIAISIRTVLPQAL